MQQAARRETIAQTADQGIGQRSLVGADSGGMPFGMTAVVDRFEELIGLDRLALVHLNDSRSELGSRMDRHEHIGAGRIGPVGLGALLRDPRLRETTFIMETPGADEGWDAVNMRRAWMLWGGATELPVLPPKAFHTNRRSTRVVRP